MRRFAELYRAIDATNRSSEKLEALESYFREAPPADAAWAAAILTGRRLGRAIGAPVVRECLLERTGLPAWLIEECYLAAGDLSETVALLLRSTGIAPPAHEPRLHRSAETLAQTIESRIIPMQTAGAADRRRLLLRAWDELPPDDLFVFHKLAGGSLRVGAARGLVERAIARAADTDPSVIAHRMAGGFLPTPASWERLVRGGQGDPSHDAARPYPFMLADSFTGAEAGPIEDYLVEWKWDGVRAQLVRRPGATALWSRGEERLDPAFPEILAAARTLPVGVVIDGELVILRGGRPLPFAELQKRLNRRTAPTSQPGLFDEDHAALLAFDLLECDGRDLRDLPLAERRRLLQEVLARCGGLDDHICVPPPAPAPDWDEAERLRASARPIAGAEGLILKRKDSSYIAGRRTGSRAAWLKHKADPFAVDAVLVGAQPGHGRRAGLLSDLTFAVIDPAATPGDSRRFVPFARAYSGLSDAELREVDAHARRTTVSRAGPVRMLRPELVFEIAFEGIRESGRHRAGVAVRFPRIARWRRDKAPGSADTLDALRSLLHRTAPGDRGATREGPPG